MTFRIQIKKKNSIRFPEDNIQNNFSDFPNMFVTEQIWKDHTIQELSPLTQTAVFKRFFMN